MAISNIGVGSGLPLDKLLEDLRKSENIALSLINDRATTVQNRLSAYGTVKGSIETLKKASDALGKAEAFGALKTSVSGDAFTATASSKAIAGQYNIEVQQLATHQTLTSVGKTSRTEVLAAGKVEIEIKIAGQDAKTLTLDSTDTSLEGIAKAINGDSSMGVSATLINDGSKSYLLLTAKNTGTEASVESISVSDAGAGTDITELQNTIGFTQGGSSNALQEKAAENAKVMFNGIEINSQTNVIEDAIEGVTLTLLKKNTAGSTDALSVTRDDAVTSKAINDFVTAYNSLQNVIKVHTSFNVDDPTNSGALSGDSLARNVQSQLRSGLNAVNDTGTVRNLSSLGITTNPNTGLLVVDSKKLETALKDGMVDVQKLFAGENGISKKLGAVADNFVKSDGVISSASDSMTQALKGLEKQYDATSLRIDAKMETYRKQFSALDSMMAQMGSISSYLTQQLSMLGNMNDSK
ncbi:flagellar filament capping protein FliD [Pollutimonas bauzanensis]|uniref:flagellar filament capping protein FliD n=1 Tax=Pollutimonas bauzanensis TaxID=658167 RepID=UPI003341D709